MVKYRHKRPTNDNDVVAAAELCMPEARTIIRALKLLPRRQHRELQDNQKSLLEHSQLRN